MGRLKNFTEDKHRGESNLKKRARLLTAGLILLRQLHLYDVDRLITLLALGDFELHLLTLFKRFIAFSCD